MTYFGPKAEPGSLFKKPAPVKAKAPKKKQRPVPREESTSHLAAIRKLPCVACGEHPCGEAAHVRMASAAHGKPLVGMATKPDDKWTVPLCHECHMTQHANGELSFWAHLARDPFDLCERLWAASPNIKAMIAIVTAPGKRA